MGKDMIDQMTGHFEEQHFDESPTLMDWCRDLFEDVCSIPADPPIPTQDQWKLKETSSYGKSSCVLPITFFDIQSNIQFLNQCNPLSIQVVDCDKHPWYYKKYTRSKTLEKSFEDMAYTTNPSSEPYGKLAGVDAIKCIDLTENTDDSFKDINTDSNRTNLNKVVTHKNKMSSITNTKKKKSYGISNVMRNDLEKLQARSQMNLSKIDLKHNTGLVGLKITPGIGFKNISVSAKSKKCIKPLASKIENNAADDCFSAASKTLELLGTIIVPVNSQVQCENVDKNSLQNNTHDYKVPSQSSVQVIVPTPEPKITNTQTHIKVRDAPFPVPNTNDIIDNDKKHSKVKLNSSTQVLGKKTNKHVKMKKPTKILERKIKILKPSGLPCLYVSNKEPCQVQENLNKQSTEDTSRSKSPIFPCISKQKIQSELEIHLKSSDKAHVELNTSGKASKTHTSHDLGQDNMVFIKDSPKSAHKYKQAPPSLQKSLDVGANKNAPNKQCHETGSIKSSTENDNKNTNIILHGNDYNMHTEPDKRDILVTTTTMNSIHLVQNIPKSRNECKEPSGYNLHTDQVRHADFIKNPKTASATNNINNGIEFKKPNMNNNSIHSNTKTNQNSRDKNLELLYQQHFVSISKSKLPPKVSHKTAKQSKTPLPKTGPPDQPIPINMSLPIHNHVSSRPESTEANPERVSSVGTSQNNGVCLVKQQTHVANKSKSNGEYSGKIPIVAASQSISASLLKQSIPGTKPAYCKVNGITNNARHPNVHETNANTEWDPRLHFPVPPFMHPPPLFLPPPPLPASLERLHIIINSLQNRAKNPTEEVKKNDANNLKDDKTMTNTKNAKNSSHNMKIKNTVEPSTLQFNHQDRSRTEEPNKNKQIIIATSHKPYLPPAINKTDALQIQLGTSTIISDKGYKNNLPEKDNTKHNTNISILQDITITPVAKDAMNTTQYNNTIKPENNLNRSVKGNDRAFNVKKKYDSSSSLYSSNNKVLLIDKHEKKPKPGPLCMKNRTGHFAVKNAASPAGLKLPSLNVNSQPKKGYSPPILPIPTFQTMLAHRHDLQVSMLNAPSITNHYPPSSTRQPSLYTSAQNRIPIPNSNAGDKTSRKRLHYEDKDANEVKKVKKISLEDYQNRYSGMDKGVGLVTDSAGVPGRKYARKSEKSFKSATLADVLNQGLDHEL